MCNGENVQCCHCGDTFPVITYPCATQAATSHCHYQSFTGVRQGGLCRKCSITPKAGVASRGYMAL